MFHFASKGGYYLSAAFIQERPLIEHIRYTEYSLVASAPIVNCLVKGRESGIGCLYACANY